MMKEYVLSLLPLWNEDAVADDEAAVLGHEVEVTCRG